MTRDEIVNLAKRKINAVNDDFWSDEEIYSYIYESELELSNNAPSVIEATHLISGVTSQSLYTIPAGVKVTKKMHWNGYPVAKSTEGKRDAQVLGNNSGINGTPKDFIEFDDFYTLFPAPSDDSTIRVWSYDLPTLTTAGDSSVSVRAEYHGVLAAGVSAKMAAKEAGHPQQARMDREWQIGVEKVKAFERKRLKGTGFKIVQLEELSVTDEFGPVY